MFAGPQVVPTRGELAAAVSLGRASGALCRGRCEKARPAGRKRGLSGVELRRIVHPLPRGPDVVGFDPRLWTAQAVSDLVTHEYRVESARAYSMNPGSAGVDLGAASSGCSQKKPNQSGEPLCSRMKTKRAFASVAHVGTTTPHFRAAISW